MSRARERAGCRSRRRDPRAREGAGAVRRRARGPEHAARGLGRGARVVPERDHGCRPARGPCSTPTDDEVPVIVLSFGLPGAAARRGAAHGRRNGARGRTASRSTRSCDGCRDADEGWARPRRNEDPGGRDERRVDGARQRATRDAAQGWPGGGRLRARRGAARRARRCRRRADGSRRDRDRRTGRRSTPSRAPCSRSRTSTAGTTRSRSGRRSPTSSGGPSGSATTSTWPSTRSIASEPVVGSTRSSASSGAPASAAAS